MKGCFLKKLWHRVGVDGSETLEFGIKQVDEG